MMVDMIIDMMMDLMKDVMIDRMKDMMKDEGVMYFENTKHLVTMKKEDK